MNSKLRFLLLLAIFNVNSNLSAMRPSLFSFMLQNHLTTFLHAKTSKFARTVKKVDLIAMFCEIKNMPNISTQTEPLLTSILTKYYFEKITTVIKKYSGQINKYTNKSLFAVFPAKSDAVFDNAFLCAIEILAESQSLEENQISSLKCCIGLAYGPAAYGVLGGNVFNERTYIGDTINIASRLQTLCDKLNTNLITDVGFFENLSESLQKKFEDFSYKPIKGKTEYIKVYGNPSANSISNDKNPNFKINKINLLKNLTQKQIEACSLLSQKGCVALFCDLRNFTTYCEENRDQPELMFKFLQIYFSEVEKIVTKYKGFIYKYLGDAVLVIFQVNSNNTAEIASLNAVKCGEEFIKIANEFNLESGVGISIGKAISINIGEFYDYFDPLCNNILIGAAIRSCSWLEEQNKNTDVKKLLFKKIIISEDVFMNLPSDYKRCFGLINPFGNNVCRPNTYILGYTSELTTVFPMIKKLRKRNYLQ